MNSAYLVLENDMAFEGKFFGAEGEITGEIVFTTGMTGYLETLTDPSYYGQIVLQTFPLIGNYGIIPADFESPAVCARAYIVKHPCANPSNFRSEGDLDAILRERGIIGLCGIDTRAVFVFFIRFLA
jgi:carbamoyl-phosphate synthase small subunit